MKKIIFIFSYLLLMSCNNDDNSNSVVIIPDTLPDVSMATFTNPTIITNPYYGPGIGQIYVYSGYEVNNPPEEEIVIERRASTRNVMGITCIIHNDLVYLNDIVIEDTDDWLAQDDDGNLWYLGEFVKNYNDDGTFKDNAGSWEAGIDDALPGYWMPNDPTVGQHYYQEFLFGEAEDEAEVLEIGVTVTIDLGTYQNCLVTKDYNKFEANVYEKKYYAPNIGFIKEEKFENNILVEVLELIEIQE